jgi:PKD repeat protein
MILFQIHFPWRDTMAIHACKAALLTCLTIKASLGYAQYPVSVLSGTYSDLVGATVVTPNSSQQYYHALNFVFPTFNRNGDFNSNASVPSLGAYITNDGYLAVYESPGYANTIVYHCFYNSNFNAAPGISSIQAKLEGTAPNRIAKFQWKDHILGNDVTQKVNFQAWFHETDSAITYHFGPNTLNSQATAGSCGLMVINQSFTGLLNQMHVKGSPAAPGTQSGNTAFSFPKLDSIPKSGTIIRFGRAPLSAPTASFSSGAGVACVNVPVVFSDLSVGSPTAWLWSVVPQAQINSPGSSTTSIIFPSSGTYTITLSSSNGAGTSAPVSKTLSVSACTGVDEDALGGSFSKMFYPNPATDNVHVNINGHAVSGIVKVEITDIAGRIVGTIALPVDRPVISTAALNPGIYYFRIITGHEGTRTEKIIIQ